LDKALHGVWRMGRDILQLHVVRLWEPQYIGFDHIGPSLHPRPRRGTEWGGVRSCVGTMEKGLKRLGRPRAWMGTAPKGFSHK